MNNTKFTPTKVAIYLGSLLLAFILFTTIFGVRIEPGHVGIVVDMYGSQKGVQEFPIVTGMNFRIPLKTSVYEYPTFVQTAVWTRDSKEGSPSNEEVSFSSKEGLVITADISLSYQLLAEKVPAFYVKFRSDDLERFTHGFLRNVARDAFNEESVQYTVEELYSTKKEEFLTKSRTRMNALVRPFGVEVQQFGFIGAPRLPDNVVNSINSKIKAIQDAIRVENELRAVEAEAKKSVAQAEGAAKARVVEAEGIAKANMAVQSSIQERNIEWKKLELQQHALDKWDGKMPQYMGAQLPLPFISNK